MDLIKKIFLVMFGMVLFLSFSAGALPIISNEEIVSISDNFAVVTWTTTNESAVGGLKWGFTQPVSNLSLEGTVAGNYHYIVLGDLYPNTTYYYKTYSHSSAGTTEGSIQSFKTLERPSGNLLFTFASMTDIHYSPNQSNTSNVRGRPYNSSEAIVTALVSYINQFSPAFTILKGDILDKAATTPAARVLTLKGKLDVLNNAAGMSKYYPIPGNHDKANPNYGAGDWVTSNLGVLYPAGAALPTGNSTFNYSFTYSGYRFIMLDSISAFGITAEVNTASLEAELIAAKAAKQKAFIVLHTEVSEESDIPNEVLAAILDQATFTTADWDNIRIKNKDSFFTLLRNYTLDNGEPVAAAVLMGHLHDNRSRTFSGVPCIRTGSSLQYSTGFDIYKVYSNGFTQTYFKLPSYSEEISRALITGTGEVTAARAQQFYLGGLSSRNLTTAYSAQNTTTAPTVESTQPANAATGVALNQPIIIKFTKPMAGTTTVANWISLNTGTISSSSWNSANTEVTLNLSSLSASASYTVTITGASAVAADGTTFSSNYSFSFTTGTTSSSTPPIVSINRLKNESGNNTDVTTDSTPTLTGIVTDETGSTVSNVEFRYASGSWSGWYAASPSDGVFNSATEVFYFSITSEVAAGEHTVQIRTTNSAGVTTTESVSAYTFYLISSRPLITLKADGSNIINGDPINPTPSLEVTAITDQTLNQLWIDIDGTRTNILPASAAFVNVVYHKPTLASGVHKIKIEAVDTNNLGTTRATTAEAVNLTVQTSGDLQVVGTPLNYPNPFNAGTENTTLSYVLSRNADITLTIHDISGTTLVKKSFTTGTSGGTAGYNTVTWNGKTDAGDVVGNGIYLYLILADGKVAAKGKLTVFKR